LADYLDPARGGYLVDDAGRRGSLAAGAAFVVAGDLNADPLDGDSTDGAIRQLLSHPLVDSATTPASRGGPEKSSQRAAANAAHQGNPAHDTADFGRVGHLRVDYVLPSKNLATVAAGVFWPASDEAGHALVRASDHRLVWLDVRGKP
jgi:3-phytase